VKPVPVPAVPKLTDDEARQLAIGQRVESLTGWRRSLVTWLLR